MQSGFPVRSSSKFLTRRDAKKSGNRFFTQIGLETFRIDRVFCAQATAPEGSVIYGVNAEPHGRLELKLNLSPSAIAGFSLAFLALSAPCARAGSSPTELDLVCTGNSYTKANDPFPTTETVSFKRDGKNSTAIEFPGSKKPTNVRVISSNPIQLKFTVDSWTGEYFNFTGDLFLIHKDGRFEKFACKPKA